MGYWDFLNLIANCAICQRPFYSVQYPCLLACRHKLGCYECLVAKVKQDGLVLCDVCGGTFSYVEVDAYLTSLQTIIYSFLQNSSLSDSDKESQAYSALTSYNRYIKSSPAPAVYPTVQNTAAAYDYFQEAEKPVEEERKEYPGSIPSTAESVRMVVTPPITRVGMPSTSSPQPRSLKPQSRTVTGVIVLLLFLVINMLYVYFLTSLSSAPSPPLPPLPPSPNP